MAATDRPDVLDAALLRPGRFDRRIMVDLPACAARRAILEVHTRGKPLADDVELDEVAGETPGFSGADLANLVNEAALGAIRRVAERIEARDFSAAFDKVQLGEPREAHLSPSEKHRVAVHEAGHALVAHRTDPDAPLRKVSIIPRGFALGATRQTTSGDKHLQTKSELEARLRVLLAGYAAEQLLLGEVSSGAENDLRQATAVAHKMVAQLGMSARIGPVFLEHRSEHPFLGARIASDSGVSDASVREIEQEARRTLGEALEDSRNIIEANRSLIETLVHELLEHETLEGDELVALLERIGTSPAPDPPNAAPDTVADEHRAQDHAVVPPHPAVA
jgi:cell division protease FtsH